MGRFAHHDQTLWDFVKRPVYYTLAFFALALFVAIPKDRKRRLIWKHGRADSEAGPGHDSGAQREAGALERADDKPADRVGSVSEEQSWSDKPVRKSLMRTRGDAL
jgi:hypothetical protein